MSKGRQGAKDAKEPESPGEAAASTQNLDATEPSGPCVYTREKMEAYIKKLEDSLNSVGDDAQLASLDLQNALQAQQQMIQLMSNISKTIHETIMSIVRKIGA